MFLFLACLYVITYFMFCLVLLFEVKTTEVKYVHKWNALKWLLFSLAVVSFKAVLFVSSQILHSSSMPSFTISTNNELALNDFLKSSQRVSQFTE